MLLNSVDVGYVCAGNRKGSHRDPITPQLKLEKEDGNNRKTNKGNQKRGTYNKVHPAFSFSFAHSVYLPNYAQTNCAVCLCNIVDIFI